MSYSTPGVPPQRDPDPKPSRLRWLALLLHPAMVALAFLFFIVVPPLLRTPTIQISPVPDTPVARGCPGDVVPIPYRIQIAENVKRADISDSWWNADARATLVDTIPLRYRNVSGPVDRVVDTEAVRIPTKHTDPATQTLEPYPPGRNEFRRVIRALSSGVLLEDDLAIPVDVLDPNSEECRR